MENNDTLKHKELQPVITMLEDMREDGCTSKSLRKIVDNVLVILRSDDNIKILCSKALEELEPVSDDGSIGFEMRTEIFNIVSMLENLSLA